MAAKDLYPELELILSKEICIDHFANRIHSTSLAIPEQEEIGLDLYIIDRFRQL